MGDVDRYTSVKLTNWISNERVMMEVVEMVGRGMRLMTEADVKEEERIKEEGGKEMKKKKKNRERPR
jgi:hypothetical protein